MTPSGHERSRAAPSRPEPSRAVPSRPEQSRAVPSSPEQSRAASCRCRSAETARTHAAELRSTMVSDVVWSNDDLTLSYAGGLFSTIRLPRNVCPRPCLDPTVTYTTRLGAGGPTSHGAAGHTVGFNTPAEGSFAGGIRCRSVSDLGGLRVHPAASTRVHRDRTRCCCHPRHWCQKTHGLARLEAS